MKKKRGSESTGQKKGTGRWTLVEDLKFFNAVMEHGKNWKMIQSVVKTRQASQIRSHAQKQFLKISNYEKQRRKNGNDAEFQHNELAQKLKDIPVTKNTPIEILRFLGVNQPDLNNPAQESVPDPLNQVPDLRVPAQMPDLRSPSLIPDLRIPAQMPDLGSPAKMPDLGSPAQMPDLGSPAYIPILVPIPPTQDEAPSTVQHVNRALGKTGSQILSQVWGEMQQESFLTTLMQYYGNPDNFQKVFCGMIDDTSFARAARVEAVSHIKEQKKTNKKQEEEEHGERVEVSSFSRNSQMHDE